MQAVTGLASAYVNGVQHRRARQPNCSADVNSAFKVGDYGISIPALQPGAAPRCTTVPQERRVRC